MTLPNFSIANQPGIGLRNAHLYQFLDEKPNINWLEIHAENFFSDDGKHMNTLEKIREHYPLSIHGIGLSLGSADPINTSHLKKLKTVIERFQPTLFSEHLSWGSVHGNYFNDLLPVPYTNESLANFCDKVKQTQDYLGRQMLIENPSTYLRYKHSDIPEWEFYAQLPEKTGCGLLLDVNNFYVSGFNHEFDPKNYLNAVNPTHIGEIHLAGFTSKKLNNGTILIDDHGSLVDDLVWQLFEKTIQKFGAKPVLIEWDTDVPDLSVLLSEADKAQKVMSQYNHA